MACANLKLLCNQFSCQKVYAFSWAIGLLRIELNFTKKAKKIVICLRKTRKVTYFYKKCRSLSLVSSLFYNDVNQLCFKILLFLYKVLSGQEYRQQVSSSHHWWKSQKRVTSSIPRVTSSNPRVTSSNPRVRRLKARVKRLKARVEAIKPRVKQ